MAPTIYDFLLDWQLLSQITYPKINSFSSTLAPLPTKWFSLSQFSSVAQSCLTLCYPMGYSMPGFPICHQHLELAQTHVHLLVMPSNHLILCCPLLLLQSVFHSIRVFSNESALCIRWPKYCSFSFNISPSSEYSGLICFRMDWFDLLAVQGLLKSLPQHHSSKVSVLRCSAANQNRKEVPSHASQNGCYENVYKP